MYIENNVKMVRCSDGCNKIAVYKIEINKKSLYLCKGCLSRLYDCMGRVLVPKSPGNFLSDIKLEEKLNL